MKRYLTMLAPAMALALGATAQAQDGTRIYGVLDLWAGTSQTSGAGAAVPVVNSGGMTTSYWGIGGSEDLGGKLKALYAVEGYLQLDTGAAGRSATDALFARNAFVGLAGAFGELKAGRILNPLFVATAQANPFGGSIRFAPLLAQMWSVPMGRAVSGDTSWDNTLAYATPASHGFQLATQVGLGETAFGGATRNAGATLTYAGAALYGSVTAQRVRVGPGLTKIGESEQATYFAGLRYDLPQVKLYASCGTAHSARPERMARTAQLGAAIPAGAGSVTLSWARTRADGAALPLSRRDTAAAGYDHVLSRRTDLYAVAQYDELGSANAAHSVGVGLRHKF